MSFESGKFGVRMLDIEGPFDAERFLEQAADLMLPPLSKIDQESVCGWAGPVGLLDRELPSASSWLLLHVVVAKRVYPPKRLDADFKAACARWKLANGAAFMPRKVKADLKDDLTAAALTDAPVGVDGIQVAIDAGRGVIYTDALTDAWLDRLAMLLIRADVTVREVSAECLCEQRGVSMVSEQPLDIGDGGQTEMFADALSREFLTWLWMMSERGGCVEIDGRDAVEVLVDGPLVLQTAGGGSVVRKVTLDGERATCGRETARALLSNKLLTKAKVMVTSKADRVFEMNVCADGLLLKGVKLPDCVSLNADDQLIERLEMCAELWAVVSALVDQFASGRGPEMEAAMREWVAAKGQEGGEPQ